MLRVEQLKILTLPLLTFSVATGECLAVEGPSGIGKTRLLRALADLDAADGYVFLNGGERREMPADRWRAKVRYVAAEPAWWAATARAHLAATERVVQLVAALGLTPAHLDQPIAELSTGERQRLAFARAVADEPDVLLLDEPTAALDARAASLVEALIRAELAAQCRIVLVSHDLGQIERLAHARLMLAPSPARQATPGVAA